MATGVESGLAPVLGFALVGALGVGSQVANQLEPERRKLLAVNRIEIGGAFGPVDHSRPHHAAIAGGQSADIAEIELGQGLRHGISRSVIEP